MSRAWRALFVCVCVHTGLTFLWEFFALYLYVCVGYLRVCLCYPRMCVCYLRMCACYLRECVCVCVCVCYLSVCEGHLSDQESSVALLCVARDREAPVGGAVPRVGPVLVAFHLHDRWNHR